MTYYISDLCEQGLHAECDVLESKDLSNIEPTCMCNHHLERIVAILKKRIKDKELKK